MDQHATAPQAALLRAFECCELPPGQLDHRTHLRLGLAFLQREHDLAAAALAFRGALRRYVRAHGVEGRYHETFTWAYLCLLEELRVQTPAADLDELLTREPALLDHRGGALARHYDVVALAACPRAARTFVLPRRGGA